MADKVSTQTLSDLITGGPIDVATGREAVPEDWAAQWRRLNPSASASDMNQDYTFARMGKVKASDGASSGGTALGRMFNTGRDAVTGVARKAFDLAGQADVASGIKTPEQAASRSDTYSKWVVPQTPASAVAALAPGVGPLAKMGLLARTGITAAAGAGANALAGESPLAGGALGAAQQVIPAVISGVGGAAANAVAKFAQKRTPAEQVQQAVDIPYAQRLLDSMKTDSPALHAAVDKIFGTAPYKVTRMQDPKVFDPAVRRVMDKIENDITAAAPQVAHPTARIDPFGTMSPQIRASVEAAGKVIPPPTPVMVPTEEAFKNWHALRGQARAQAGNPSAAHDLYEQARQWEDAITQSIPKSMSKAWEAARAEFGRATRWQELAREAGRAAGPTAEGTPFNPAGVVEKFFANPQRYAQSALPGLHKTFFAAGQPGTQPTVFRAGGYGHIPGLRMGGMHMPLGTYVTEPGKQYGAPGAAEALRKIAQTGVYSLGNTLSPGQE